MEFSREFGLTANVIEKDYVLGWILAGIFNHPSVGSSWAFRGGTCLKKCYFETYRFSEDLDFTLTESDHLNQEFLLSCFREIAQWVYRVDRIQGAEITQISFVPEHAVELTPAGPVSVPELSPSSNGSVPVSSAHHSGFGSQGPRPLYVIECPYCGRGFTRRRMDTRLRPHRDRQGHPCSGRSGYLVDTKY